MPARTIFCPFCGLVDVRKFGKDRHGRQRYHCPDCDRTFGRRTRTVRSGSRLSEQDWRLAARLFAARGGMSGADLARVLGYGRRTGQRLNRAFRHLAVALVPRSLPGATEWDEAMFSGQWVLGGVSRHTRQCLLRTIDSRSERTLTPLVERSTDGESPIMTDEHGGYHRLLNHWTVCHSREFVRKEARFVHTNTQEGIWGHAKELSRHTYRGFPKDSLPSFLAEFMFRYNLPNYAQRVSVLSALLARKINTDVV